MKKTILVLAMTMMSVVAMADSWIVTVGTNAVIVAPAFDPAFKLADGTYTNFYTLEDYNSRTNVYTQGEYMSLNKVRYWTPNGGTSTNAPTHKMGVATGADGVTWVVLNKYQLPRSCIISIAGDEGTVYIDDNATATTNAFPLTASDIIAVDREGFVGYTSGITSSGTVSLRVKVNY